MGDAPVRPLKPTDRPQSEAAVPFNRRPMVDWLSPAQLARTGLKVALAESFGAYFDKRELQGAIGGHTNSYSPVTADYTIDPKTANEIWFDYVADLGDGFNSTYAIARLLAASELNINGQRLPRGRFLLMGGDQVYPTASREDYADRLEGPYRAALPWIDDRRVDPPHLFAIPGNHDWYDGLTSFLRLFCQYPRQRWIGGWLTRQNRSYFSLKLPHGWWIWGADLQTGDIDKPQLDYFERVANRMLREQAESAKPQSAIIITAEPSWVHCVAGGKSLSKGFNEPEKFNSLHYLEDILRDQGLRVAAVVSGDLHHYCRYQQQGSDSPTERITSGGGGAYLYATHHMPESLDVPEGQGNPVNYQLLDPRYPSKEQSSAMSRGILKLPFRNYRFGGTLAALYTLFAWTFQSASINNNKMLDIQPYATKVTSLLTLTHPNFAFSQFCQGLGTTLSHSPASVLFAIAVMAALWGFTHREPESYGYIRWAGVIHGLLHVLLAIALFWIFGRSAQFLWPNWKLDSPCYAAAFTLAMLIAGGLLGGWLFAGYLLLMSKLTGAHMNEVFSSQSIEDYKSFLRCHVNPNGELTIYAIELHRTPTKWRLDHGPSADDKQNSQQSPDGVAPPWFKPVNASSEPELIEDFTIKHRGTP